MSADALLYALQKGLPLVEEPFQVIGAGLGLTSSEVFSQIETFQKDGIIRRVGAVFNATQFGYKSALCGIAVPEPELEKIARLFANHSGVTHNYARSARPNGSLEPLCEDGTNKIPNLWFTLSVPQWDFDAEIKKLQEQIAYPIRIAPATERFKVQVVLDPAALKTSSISLSTADEIPLVGTEVMETSAQDREFIRRMQVDFPLVEKPYHSLAHAVGMAPQEALAKLQHWKNTGALRRVALLARHQKMGYHANAMCVWKAPEDQIKDLGQRLAARREITHCYRREPFAGFPYNLFAMIHAGDTEALQTLAQEISNLIQVPLGHLFVSAHEFKKTSLTVFGS